MLEDALRSGFALAHRSVRLILLDLFWKAVWGALTVAGFLAAVVWITSDLRGIQWEDAGLSAVNGLIVSILLREYWQANGAGIIATIVAFLFTSAVLWVLLEAFCRRTIVREIAYRQGRNPAAAGAFQIFLLSSISKNSIVLASLLVLVAISRAGATVAGIVTFFAAAFLLSLLDTLIRADAVELLGTDLIRVAGVLGILMFIEGTVAGALLLVLTAGFFNASGPEDVAVLLGTGAAIVAFVAVLHSYLLIVRFSVVAIMRQNVVEV
jgi:hypothetical protein